MKGENKRHKVKQIYLQTKKDLPQAVLRESINWAENL